MRSSNKRVLTMSVFALAATLACAESLRAHGAHEHDRGRPTEPWEWLPANVQSTVRLDVDALKSDVAGTLRSGRDGDHGPELTLKDIVETFLPQASPCEPLLEQVHSIVAAQSNPAGGPGGETDFVVIVSGDFSPAAVRGCASTVLPDFERTFRADGKDLVVSKNVAAGHPTIALLQNRHLIVGDPRIVDGVLARARGNAELEPQADPRVAAWMREKAPGQDLAGFTRNSDGLRGAFGDAASSIGWTTYAVSLHDGIRGMVECDAQDEGKAKALQSAWQRRLDELAGDPNAAVWKPLVTSSRVATHGAEVEFAATLDRNASHDLWGNLAGSMLQDLQSTADTSQAAR